MKFVSPMDFPVCKARSSLLYFAYCDGCVARWDDIVCYLFVTCHHVASWEKVFLIWNWSPELSNLLIVWGILEGDVISPRFANILDELSKKFFFSCFSLRSSSSSFLPIDCHFSFFQIVNPLLEVELPFMFHLSLALFSWLTLFFKGGSFN